MGTKSVNQKATCNIVQRPGQVLKNEIVVTIPAGIDLVKKSNFLGKRAGKYGMQMAVIIK